MKNTLNFFYYLLGGVKDLLYVAVAGIFIVGVSLIAVNVFILVVSMTIKCVTGVDLIGQYIQPFFKVLL